MKNRPKARILRIESMGSELVSLNIMTDSVGSEVKSLTDRWATLNEKVKKKEFKCHLLLVCCSFKTYGCLKYCRLGWLSYATCKTIRSPLCALITLLSHSPGFCRVDYGHDLVHKWGFGIIEFPLILFQRPKRKPSGWKNAFVGLSSVSNVWSSCIAPSVRSMPNCAPPWNKISMVTNYPN